MKQLLILSGKGGTGKTTVSSAFINLSQAKIFADCDVDAPNLHLTMSPTTEPIRSDYFGMGRAKIDTAKCTNCGLCMRHCQFKAITSLKVNPFSCEGCGVCEAICPTGAIRLHDYVAGDLMCYKEDFLFSTAKLRIGSGTSGKLVTEVKKQIYCPEEIDELAIIDGSPGIGCPVIASLSGVDMVLVVAEPSLSGISDMKRIIATAKNFEPKIAVCINKFDLQEKCTKEIERICEKENIPIAGKIPFDSTVIEAINTGKSIISFDCKASSAIKNVFTKTLNILYS